MLTSILLALALASPAEIGRAHTCTTFVDNPHFNAVPDCDKDAPDRCAVPLARGEGAPFGGVLLSPPLVAHMVTAHREVKAELALQIEKNEKDLKAAEAAREEERKAANKRLDEAISSVAPTIFERPLFVIPVTVAVTLGVVFGVAKMIEASK